MYSGRHPWDANDPYPDDGRPQDECDHEDYAADILTGVATCDVCGHRWDQTAADLKREREAQIAYDNYCAEWEKRNPGAPRDLVGTRPTSGPYDDELPF